VPIIAISGGGPARFDYLPAARALGATRIFGKPFDNAALLDAVRELLGR
jgi:hypothetical protein